VLIDNATACDNETNASECVNTTSTTITTSTSTVTTSTSTRTTTTTLPAVCPGGLPLSPVTVCPLNLDLPACDKVKAGGLCRSAMGECGTDSRLVNCPPLASIYQASGEADTSGASGSKLALLRLLGFSCLLVRGLSAVIV
jgi:hypothetical protein